MHRGIDFDCLIVEMCFHMIADDRLQLLTSAEIERFLSQQSRSLTIADDLRIAEKCFQIIADDRWHIFSDPATMSAHMETRL